MLLLNTTTRENFLEKKCKNALKNKRKIREHTNKKIFFTPILRFFSNNDLLVKKIKKSLKIKFP